MNWFQLVIFLLVLGACIWLVVDTTIYVIKKVKEKKKNKQIQNNAEDVNNDK